MVFYFAINLFIISVASNVYGNPVNETVETSEEMSDETRDETIPLLLKYSLHAPSVKRYTEGGFGTTFAEQCKNVSGVDYDYERSDSIYKEYQNCVRDLDYARWYDLSIDNIEHIINGTETDVNELIFFEATEKFVENL